MFVLVYQVRTQKEHFMENNINGANTPGLAAQILARYRQTAQKFGPFFGQQIFTIVAQTLTLSGKKM